MLTNIAFVLLKLLALMSSVSYIQCKDEIQHSFEDVFKISNSELLIKNQKRDTTDDRESVTLDNGITVKNFIDPEKGFLAGEDTPVWLAEGHGAGKDVTYTKLPKGIVKKAMRYWNSMKKQGMPWKSRIFVGNSASGKDTTIEYVKRTSQSFVNSNVHKRSSPDWVQFSPENPWGEIFRPSILAIVDFKTDWPNSRIGQDIVIQKRILYALAFWNGVDLQLRPFKKYESRMYLRIAGIIIARNKEATPYDYQTVMNYWSTLARKNPDFSEKAYHIAATLTDDEDKISGESFSAHNGDYCKSNPPIATMMAIDNHGFTGIKAAVHEVVHLLGAAYDSVPVTDEDMRCPNLDNTVMASDYSILGRQWTDCISHQIWSHMRGSGSCMRSAAEYHPPGKRVEPILPGLYYRAKVQCQAGGWEDGYVCWEYSTCSNLYCANNSTWSRCSDYGPPQDGTSCGKDQICLDEECIDKPLFLSNA